jgi:hypothetical protein
MAGMLTTLAAAYRLPIPAWFIVLMIGAGVLAAAAAIATAILVNRRRSK